MSRFVLSQIHIDVLVQLAMYGPMEATSWKPLAADADALGASLWQQNWDAAAYPEEDPPLPAYKFRLLPFGITAAEGLKACSCYGYQTADDIEAWADGPARPVVEQLKSELVRVLTEAQDIPWDWGPGDIHARMERGGAPVPAAASVPGTDDQTGPKPTPEDPLTAAVEEAFAAAGIDLALPFANPGPFTDIDPRDRIARREVRVTGVSPAPVLSVEIYTDEAVARSVTRTLRMTLQRMSPTSNYRLARVGRVVIHYTPYNDDHLPPHLKDGVSALGVPDELWTTAEPPLAVAGGSVLASRVQLISSSRGSHRVMVGHDSASVRSMAARIVDASVRQQLEAVDLQRYTPMLVVGLAAAESVELVSLYSRIDEEDEPDYLELRLATTGGCSEIATMLLVDRLAEMPRYFVLRDPAIGGWGGPVDKD